MADLSTEQVSFEQALANLLLLYGVGTGSGTIVSERLTLINAVKAKLDEIIPEGEGVQFAVDGDTNISDPMNLLINAILDEAAKRVLLNAPAHILDVVKSNATATPDTDDPKIGFILLPDNFLRLISLKMKEWKRPVTALITPGSEEYQMQFNVHVRGGIAKPKAAMAHRTVEIDVEGTPTLFNKRVLEYWSTLYTSDIDWLYYVQETSAQNLQSNLTDALTWMTAGMVLQVTERADLARAAFEQEQSSYLNL